MNIDGHMDGWKDGKMDGWIDILMDVWTGVKVKSDKGCLNLALSEFLVVLQVKSQFHLVDEYWHFSL